MGITQNSLGTSNVLHVRGIDSCQVETAVSAVCEARASLDIDVALVQFSSTPPIAIFALSEHRDMVPTRNKHV